MVARLWFNAMSELGYPRPSRVKINYRKSDIQLVLICH